MKELSTGIFSSAPDVASDLDADFSEGGAQSIWTLEADNPSKTEHTITW